jgi:hypothetical protein
MTPELNELSIGIAGEHLVCADLILQGHRAFMANQDCPYDIAVESGGRLIRIQVKSTQRQRGIPQRATHIPAYMWHVRRAGKGAKRVYSATDFDLLALVALDIRRIAYIAPSQTKMTIHIRPPNTIGGKQFDTYTLSAALTEVFNDSRI